MRWVNLMLLLLAGCREVVDSTGVREMHYPDGRRVVLGVEGIRLEVLSK